jgi:hypothetical protein
MEMERAATGRPFAQQRAGLAGGRILRAGLAVGLTLISRMGLLFIFDETNKERSHRAIASRY